MEFVKTQKFTSTYDVGDIVKFIEPDKDTKFVGVVEKVIFLEEEERFNYEVGTLKTLPYFDDIEEGVKVVSDDCMLGILSALLRYQLDQLKQLVQKSSEKKEDCFSVFKKEEEA